LKNKRQQVRETIRKAEKRVIQIFESKNYTIQRDDFRFADRIASDLDEQLYQKYKIQPFKYPMIPYGIYWKIMNWLDGFRL
jgi:hypothetical protein